MKGVPRVSAALFTAAIVVVFSSGSLAGCSATTKASDTQCSADADCAARGLAGTVCVNSTCVASDAGSTTTMSTDASDDAPSEAAGGDPAWACLGNVSWPPENTAVTLHRLEQFGLRGSQAPVVGISVYSCALHDLDCKNPIDTQITDSTGTVALAMPQYFRGYMYMPGATDDAGQPKFVPTMSFFFPPPVDDYGSKGPILNPLFPPGQWATVGGVLGANVDDTLGSAVTLAYDCLGHAASDIHIDVQPTNPDPNHPTVVGYVSAGGIPSVSPAQTSSDGGVGVFNIPPGTVTFTATNVTLGKVVGTLSLLVRAHTMTAFVFPPTP